MPEQFLEEMKQLLKEDYEKLLDSYNEEPKKSIRLQQEKISTSEWNKLSPFTSNEISGISGSYYVNALKIGNHPYHHAGLFYVQEPSAMLPPLLAPIKKDFKILDLCAAPGGKTLSLSNQVPDGFVVSNEIQYSRAKKLLSNVERLGLKNVIISNHNSKELKKVYECYFDVVLIDAPCSGEGMFRKDEMARKEWSKEKVEELSSIQAELLEDGASMLKENGYLIYSTCTFNTKENEEQIVKFIKKHNFEILEISPIFNSYTKKGFVIDSNIPTDKSRRCYPYLYGEGQFMILLRKKEKTEEKKIINQLTDLTHLELKIVESFLKESMKSQNYIIKKYQNNIVVVPNEHFEIPKLGLLSSFVKVGDIIKDRFVPHHQFVKAYGMDFKNQCLLTLEDKRVVSYLKGEEIEADVLDGYGVVMVDGYPLGLFKAKNKKLKNHYPKGLRYQN